MNEQFEISVRKYWNGINTRTNEGFKDRFTTYENVPNKFKSYEQFRQYCKKHLLVIGDWIDCDKDLLATDYNNKSYNKDNVCFIPHSINCAIRGHKRTDDLCQGVYKLENGRYLAKVNSDVIGTYDTYEEAFAERMLAKQEVLDELAEHYKDVIEYRVYKTLKQYYVRELQCDKSEIA